MQNLFKLNILHEIRVHDCNMKNITFTADESLIQKAREKAKRENTSLNKRFREWLERYTSRGEREEEIKDILSRFDYAKSGKSFSRDELNER